MGKCVICNRESNTISNRVNVCVDCLRKGYGLDIVEEIHRETRLKLGLTQTTPSNVGGVKCNVCGRGCLLIEGAMGYCSVRGLENGVLRTTTSQDSIIGLYYYDPHPTNCVAFPVCPAVRGLGYPKYALRRDGEYGYYNIAVFPGACSMNCLYCQNWEFRLMSRRRTPILTMEKLVSSVNHKTTCVCYFGGDPGPYITFLIEASRRMINRAKEIGLRVFRICWETNGLQNPVLFKKAVELSLETGGIVKVDFKAWSPEVYKALTGVEPSHVDLIKRNIIYVAEKTYERVEPPLLVVSTLLVPGYVDEYEVDCMTRFVAELNPEIPYVFLGFHPDFELMDLPRTSRKHVAKAVEIARRNGLKNVYVGNEWLLSDAY